MKCPSCGEDNVANARFCAYCGKKLFAPAGADDLTPRRHMPVITPAGEDAEGNEKKTDVFLFDDEKEEAEKRTRTLEGEKATARKRMAQQRLDNPFYGEDDDPDEDELDDDFDDEDEVPSPARHIIMIVALALTLIALVGVGAGFLFGTSAGRRVRATYGIAATWSDYFELGEWHRGNANYADAAEAYYKAFLLNRNDYTFGLTVAQAFESCGALERAEQMYLYLIDRYPQEDAPYDNLMALLLREGKREQYNGLIALRAENQPGYSSPIISASSVPDEPVPSPRGGNFTGGVSITLTAQEGAQIYFSLDGTDPTAESRPYTEPIRLYTGSYTLRAVAILDGISSPVMKATYVIS